MDLLKYQSFIQPFCTNKSIKGSNVKIIYSKTDSRFVQCTGVTIILARLAFKIRNIRLYMTVFDYSASLLSTHNKNMHILCKTTGLFTRIVVPKSTALNSQIARELLKLCCYSLSDNRRETVNLGKAEYLDLMDFFLKHPVL